MCVCVCVAFRIGFCSVFAISRLSAHASFDLHLSLNSVRGFGGDWGDGGMMTSMRLRLVFSFSFGDLLLLGCGAVCRKRLVVISGYFVLDFPLDYHAKTSSFCSLPDKNFATDPNIEQKQNTKSMVFAIFSANMLPKKQEQRTLEN